MCLSVLNVNGNAVPCVCARRSTHESEIKPASLHVARNLFFNNYIAY